MSVLCFALRILIVTFLRLVTLISFLSTFTFLSWTVNYLVYLVKREELRFNSFASEKVHKRWVGGSEKSGQHVFETEFPLKSHMKKYKNILEPMNQLIVDRHNLVEKYSLENQFFPSQVEVVYSSSTVPTKH